MIARPWIKAQVRLDFTPTLLTGVGDEAYRDGGTDLLCPTRVVFAKIGVYRPDRLVIQNPDDPLQMCKEITGTVKNRKTSPDGDLVCDIKFEAIDGGDDLTIT